MNKKYIVIYYRKDIGYADSFVFDTIKEALISVFENHLIDKKHNEENNWIYKIVEIIF